MVARKRGPGSLYQRHPRYVRRGGRGALARGGGGVRGRRGAAQRCGVAAAAADASTRARHAAADCLRCALSYCVGVA